MAWDPAKPAGTDAANTIDNTVQGNFSALDTWASAITDGVSAGVSVILKAYRAALTTILKLRSDAADTQDRFQLTTDGKQYWGSGAVAPARAWDGPRLVRAYVGAQYAATLNAVTAVTFNSETFDTDALHSTVSNTSRITAPVAGKYLVTGTAWIIGLNDSLLWSYIAIRKGGTTEYARVGISGSASSDVHSQVTALVDLAAAGYVELVYYLNGTSLTSATINTPGTHLSATYLGE